MTESGKVEVVDIKFGNKTYENVSVKHLNPTDEGSHSHKRTSKELGVKKKKSKKESVMSSKLEELVGKPITEEQFDEAAGKKDACYHKVKARYDVWPSAYASGALVKCRKVGAKNWGNSKKEGLGEAKQRTSVGKSELSREIKKIRRESPSKYFKPMGDTLVRHLAHNLNATSAAIYKAMIKYNVGTEYIKGISYEGLGDRMAKKLKKHKGVNLKKKKIKLKGRGVYQDYDGLKEDVFIETNTNGKMKTTHVYYESDGKGYGYTLEFVNELNEAEYQGRKVKLGKIMQGDVKKFKVYVKNPKGNVVKVNFGQGGDAKGGTMRIRKSNAAARKSFRARHNCDNPGPRHKARYWSCRKW